MDNNPPPQPTPVPPQPQAPPPPPPSPYPNMPAPQPPVNPTPPYTPPQAMPIQPVQPVQPVYTTPPVPPVQPAPNYAVPPAVPAQPATTAMAPAPLASTSQPLLTPILGKPLFKWLIAALFLGIAIGNFWHSIHIFRLMSNLNDIGSEFLESNTELSKFYHTISIVSLLFGLLRLGVAACVLFASKIGRILLYVTAGAQAVYTIVYASMFMGKIVIADKDKALPGLLWGILFLAINIGIILYISLSKPIKQSI